MRILDITIKSGCSGLDLAFGPRWRYGRRDELLNREIFYTLKEAQVLVERWRREYNQIRPHSTLGYRPPAPEVVEPVPVEAKP